MGWEDFKKKAMERFKEEADDIKKTNFFAPTAERREAFDINKTKPIYADSPRKNLARDIAAKIKK